MAYQAPSLSEFISLGRAMRTGMDSRDERARREREEQRQQELHDARMNEYKSKRDGQIALANAAAPATVDSGFQVTDTAGSNAFTKDADAAAAMQDMAGSTGATPTLASATRVNKDVFTDPERAKKAERDYNSVDATAQRQVRAMQARDPAGALTLANTISTHQKQKRAEQDVDFERGIYGAQDQQSLADFMTKTMTEQMGTDVKAEIAPSPDGSSWILGVNVGGQRHPIGQFSNDDDGLKKAKETVYNRMASPEAQRNLEKFKADINHKKMTAEAAAKNADANQRRAAAAEKAAGNGGAAGGRIQKTFVDNEGYMVGVFRDGTSRRLEDDDGNPIRADSAEKRVDVLTKYLMDNSREHRRKPYAEVRKSAEEILRGSQAPGGAAGASPSQGASGGVAQPNSQAEYDALPKGARYMRDGQIYIKN